MDGLDILIDFPMNRTGLKLSQCRWHRSLTRCPRLLSQCFTKSKMREMRERNQFMFYVLSKTVRIDRFSYTRSCKRLLKEKL